MVPLPDTEDELNETTELPDEVDVDKEPVALVEELLYRAEEYGIEVLPDTVLD